MKIGNTSVTGVFMYTDDAKFEKNDFVIYDTTIYICKPTDGITEVSGEIPLDSKNFIVYLGDQSTNISEYLEFLNTGTGENKYISAGVLQQVLNSFMVGLDGKGIITGVIEKNDQSGTESSNLPGVEDMTTGILDEVMVTDNINHAIFKVSRGLSEFQTYLKGIDYVTDSEYCILRQYTYFTSENHKIRIQELIDQELGLIYYRTADLTSNESRPSISNFSCASGNLEIIKKKADNIFALYNSRLNVLRSLEKHLKNNFRFRKLDIPEKTIDIPFSGIAQNLPEITVTLTEYDIEKNIRYNSETSFSLADKVSEGVWPEYRIGDNYKIQVSVSVDSGDIRLAVKTLSDEIPDKEKVWISNIYYREYYDF